MKRLLLVLLCLCLPVSVAMAEGGMVGYRFVDADEAAEMLLANREYYANMNQIDLDFRMQKKGATLAELEAMAAKQTLDFTDEEKAAVDDAMTMIEAVCAERGYALPAMDDIIFAKTTMHEECGSSAYTHGSEIYLAEYLLRYGMMDEPDKQSFFKHIMAHELFHCLTRNHPDFRADMYGILGFTVEDEDYPLGQSIKDVMISNPDVEHHNAHAAFDINGEMKDCVVVFTTGKPFEKPGDSFFDDMVTGLVPIDDLDTMYTSEDAANFWEVFGNNTGYVIDPEEILAENFAFTIVDGLDKEYANPEIIEAIDALLKAD